MMSYSSTSTGRPPKIMSSRLMTMKFMQRAAASNASPTTPNDAYLPSPKRQKLQDALPVTPSFDAQVSKAALVAEEAKRSEALDSPTVGAAETKWVLSYHEERPIDNQMGVHFMSVGYGGVDIANGNKREMEEPWREQMLGRRSFGRFNRALEKQQNPQIDISSSDDSVEDDIDKDAGSKNNSGDSDDDPQGIKELFKASRSEAAQRLKTERKAQRRAKKAEAARLAEKRKSKEVKLNKLSSISGGGGSGGFLGKECYLCGKKGHSKKDCPMRASKRAGTEQ